MRIYEKRDRAKIQIFISLQKLFERIVRFLDHFVQGYFLRDCLNPIKKSQLNCVKKKKKTKRSLSYFITCDRFVRNRREKRSKRFLVGETSYLTHSF